MENENQENQESVEQPMNEAPRQDLGNIQPGDNHWKPVQKFHKEEFGHDLDGMIGFVVTKDENGNDEHSLFFLGEMSMNRIMNAAMIYTKRK